MNTTWQLVKLKCAGKYKRFRKSRCEFTGKTGTIRNPLEVHHGGQTKAQIIESWQKGWIDFDRALWLINDDEKNYYTLTHKAHEVIGHCEDWKQANPNIRAVIDANKGGL
jgi:hypothetical protein